VRPAQLLRWTARESRGSRGRMAFFAGCLAVGTAAVTAVAGLVEGIEAGVRAKSREVLGCDLTVDGRRPLPAEIDALLAGVPGLERTDLRDLATMAAAPGQDGSPARSRLCNLRVVRGRWPLHGEIETRPAGGLAPFLADDAAVVAEELLPALGIRVGDTVLLGGASFRVAAAVTREPVRLGFQAVLGPRVFLTEGGLARTALLGFGNRVQYRAMFALPGNPSEEALAALQARLKDGLPGAAFLDVDTHFDAEPGVARQLARVRSAAGLTALLSLVLGGIGVSQIVRAWLEGKAAAVAVLRCLGMGSSEILLLHLSHVGALALAGSLLGALAGAAVVPLVPAAAPDLFPPGLFTPFRLPALLRGVGLGVGIALVFALPPLAALRRVPPMRALRADAEPLPPARGVRAAAHVALGIGVFLAAWAQDGSPLRAAAFTGGLALLAALLALGARGAMRLAAVLPRERLGPILRHGVAALARPGAGTTGAVTALGLGTMVVCGMWLVETRLLDGLRASIPESAPTVFLVDIQPDRWDEVRGVLEAEGAAAVDHVPVVMARLASVDGRSVEDLAAASEDAGRRSWVLTREQRLTWRGTLPADNVLVEGALWSDPAPDEVSLEEGFARDLGARLGTRLVFDVQGIPVSLRVTSIRKVEWTSFAINFFVVAEPGALEGAPAFFIANGRLEPAAEQRAQDRLAAVAPGVTMIRIRPVLERILELAGRAAFGIRVLGSFTILAGLAILAGAVGASTVRRARETALLKALGVTRAGVAGLLAVEYGLCGLVAGAVGAGGAAALAVGFLVQVAGVEAPIPWLLVPGAALGCAALAAGCGLVASARALSARPVEVLRGA
jgi:putative ABC transport system permease protein